MSVSIVCVCARMCLCLCFSNGVCTFNFICYNDNKAILFSVPSFNFIPPLAFFPPVLNFVCIKLHFLFYFGELVFLVHCLEFCFLYSSVMILFSRVSFSPVVSTPLITLLYIYSCSLSFCLCRGGSSLSSHVSQRALALRLTNVV